MSFNWQALVKKTILKPKDAAREIIQLRQLLSREMLWSMVIVVAALMAMSYWVQWELFPPAAPASPQEAAAQQIMERIAARPFLAATLFACGIVVLINVLHWTGRLFGGTGGLHDMAAVFLWLQFFLVAAGALTLVLALVLMPLAALIAMIANVLGLWILIAFVDEVHGFNSPFKSLGVLIAGVVLMVLGFMLLAFLILTTGAGVAAHV
ncbi:YIP1 family protein [Rhodobacteraceae bacterium D3-12]|nr:YIP1 family protein [Rhodobacteraceae bacterium D3-12]